MSRTDALDMNHFLITWWFILPFFACTLMLILASFDASFNIQFAYVRLCSVCFFWEISYYFSLVFWGDCLLWNLAQALGCVRWGSEGNFHLLFVGCSYGMQRAHNHKSILTPDLSTSASALPRLLRWVRTFSLSFSSCNIELEGNRL